MKDQTALPLYVEVSEMLIRDMTAGRLLDGERLPPERNMARDLGISVGTLRKALGLLENKGQLTRRHGSGNYVHHKPDVDSVYAFFRLEKPDGGGLPTADILDVTKLSKPASLPAFGTSENAHRIRRLRRLDGEPVAVEEIWLDGSYAQRLSPEVLSHSLYLFYRSRLGLRITRVEDRVGVGVVPDWAEGLDVLAGTPAGHVDRISWAQDGQAAEVSTTIFNPARARYVQRLK